MTDTHSPTKTAKATEASHMDALAPGTRLAEFEIQGLLGVGGFGMVYRGYDHSLHRPVAIKEYMPTSLVGRDRNCSVTVKSASDAVSFETGLRSFITEARLLARFDHPSLVKVYRFWEANNTAYMAMPLYEGITLKEARRRMSGPPAQAWLQTVLWSVLSGLKVLHDSNILHRDVSPDNIFLQNIGPPVLLDLGAARRAILDTSQKHTAVLKVNYAPIEQYADAKDMQEGPWTDLYAVAAVMHGCICNEPPLPATFRAVRDRMPSFAQVTQTAQNHFNQTYSDAFVQAVSHALAIEPMERTASVDAFVREMGMESPPDLASFEWRKALGESVTLIETEENTSPSAAEISAPQSPSDFPDTVFQFASYDQVKTVKTDSRGNTDAPSQQTKSVAKVRKGAAIGVWLVPAAIALALGYWWLRPVATMPAPAHAPATPVSPVSAPSAVITESATMITETAEVPAKPIAPQPASKPSAPAASAQNAAAPAKPVHQAPVAAAGKATSAKQPPQPEVKSVEEKPEPAKGPLANCADASIFTRVMCVYRECQKPEFFNLPVCVADRKHWEEKNKEIN